MGLVIVLAYLVVSLVSGKRSGPNPWGSRGFEWNTPSPPGKENFPETPTFTHGAHEYQTPDGDDEVKHAA
jgi:cytochrome c oxidase subunit 1